MLSETVAVNPWNINEVGEKIDYALKLSVKERRRRWTLMYSYLKGYTATDWASSFMSKLQSTSHINQMKKISTAAKVRKRIRKKNSVILLDYDGTLVPIKERPEEAVLESSTKSLLRRLSKSHQVAVVSGRPRDFLESQLGDLDISLASEHGGLARLRGEKRWKNRVGTKKPEWYRAALQIMADYGKRVPNSFVEKKTLAIAWHYRLAPAEYSAYVARKLLEELELTFSSSPTSIISGKKVIEVRAVEANKGHFARDFLSRHQGVEQVLAIGDDATDEDLFAAVKDIGLSVRVGQAPTVADMVVGQQEDTLAILEGLVL